MITVQWLWVDLLITTTSILRRRKERHSSNKCLTSQACNSRRWQQHREARLRAVPLFLQIKCGESCLARCHARGLVRVSHVSLNGLRKNRLLVVYREPLRARQQQELSQRRIFKFICNLLSLLFSKRSVNVADNSFSIVLIAQKILNENVHVHVTEGRRCLIAGNIFNNS